MKKWIIGAVICLFVVGLYVIELSRIQTDNITQSMPTLDELEVDEAAREWEPFYRVRATIIDGQSADFSIPRELRESVGREMELTGAAVFFDAGCKSYGDSATVNSFFLLPSLGLAEACVILPDVAMRWTIRINTRNNWLISRNDMISTEVKVKGKFRINTEKPYEAAFFLDDADVELLP